MREAGIEVNEVPKIHLKDLDVKGHSIYFALSNFRISLSFWGVYSYFPVTKPSIQELNDN